MIQANISGVRGVLTAFTALTLAAADTMAQKRTEPFWLGVDISFAGSQPPAARVNLLNALKAHGVNSVRLRTFVDPTAADGYSNAGACGLAPTIEFAKQVKAAGMSYLLDFHYSNNWADPAKQCVPIEWQKFTTIAQLAQAVHDYTKDAIIKHIAAGARPDMVAIGNETSPGMLIHRCDSKGEPTGDNPVNGSTRNWANLGPLLKAGVEAVKGVDPTILTSFHLNKGGDHTDGRSALNFSVNWLTNALKYTQVDAFGESCYHTYQGDKNSASKTKTIWQNVQSGLLEKFPKIKLYVAEYGGFEREINDVNFNLPNQMGIGTYFWEATMNSASWNNGPLVTGSNGSYAWSPSKVGIYDKMVQDYGLELIPVGIAAKENILKADSRGRLRLFNPAEGMLFRSPDPARKGLLTDGLGRMILPAGGGS